MRPRRERPQVGRVPRGSFAPQSGRSCQRYPFPESGRPLLVQQQPGSYALLRALFLDGVADRGGGKHEHGRCLPSRDHYLIHWNGIVRLAREKRLDQPHSGRRQKRLRNRRRFASHRRKPLWAAGGKSGARMDDL